MRHQNPWYFAALILAFASSSFATGKLLPKLKTEEEKRTFLNEVQMQVPFAAHNNEHMLQRQILGVEFLTKTFPDYKKQIAAKPGPFVFELFSIETQNEQTYFLEKDRYLEVLSELRGLLNDGLQKAPANTTMEQKIAVLGNHALTQLKEALEQSNDSVRGILTGLSQLLPNEEKAAFFKLGIPSAQLDFLEKKGFTDETLKNSSFRPEAVGLTMETITIAKVFTLARNRLQSTSRIFTYLSYLQMLRKLQSLSIKDQTNFFSKRLGLEKVLSNSDFNFVVRGNDPLIASVTQTLAGNDEKSQSRIRQLFENFQNSFSRKVFQVGVQELKTRKKIGTLSEVHPFLGVHRGCIGGDCSTTNSPMFPYSPWEHIFYIQDASNRIVGYISATRVVIEKKDTLYVKDINGYNLSPDLAEACLYALNASLSKYGVTQFAVATPGFTNGNNRNQAVKQMLQKYNTATPSRVQFPDKDIRAAIGSNNEVFRSTLTYDSIQTHQTAIVFKAEQVVANRMGFDLREGTLLKPDLSELSRNLAKALKTSIFNDLRFMESVDNISTITLNQIKSILQNGVGLPIQKFHDVLDAFFKSSGLDQDIVLSKQNEMLLYMGHLNATDAFDPKQKKSVLTTSFRYFTELAKLRTMPALIARTYQRASEELESSPEFISWLQTLEGNMETRDVLDLASLAYNGSKKAKHILKKAANQEKVESAILDILQNGVVKFGYGVYDYAALGKQHGPIHLRTHLYSASTRTVEQTSELLDGDIGFFGLDWKSIQNPQLRNQIQAAFISATDSFDSKYRQRTKQVLNQLINSDGFPNFAFSRTVHRLMKAKENVTNIVNKRVQFLSQNPTEANVLEIFGYHMLDFESAAVALGPDYLYKQKFDIVYKAMTKGLFENSNSQSMYQQLGQYHDPKYISLPSSRSLFNQYFNTAEEAYARYHRVMEVFGLSGTDLFKMKNIHRNIATLWSNLPDAYNSPNQDVIEASMSIVENIIRGHQTPALPAGFSNHIEFLKQKSSFQNMIQRITQDMSSDDCLGCRHVIVGLINEGKIDAKSVLTPDAIRKLFQSQDLSIRAFALSAAIDFGMLDQVNDNRLAEAFQNFESHFQYTNQVAHYRFRLRLINSFLKLKTNSEFFAENLLKIAKMDNLDEVALRAAVAFIRLGGDRKIAMEQFSSRYNRWEYRKAETAEVVQLRNELQGIQPSQSQKQSCMRLFHAR